MLRPRRMGEGKTLLVSLFVCGLTLLTMAVCVRGWTPSSGVPMVPDSSEIAVLGSSIALANVDPVALSASTGLSVVQLGERASQPAHWLALLRHRVPEDVRLKHLVVVSPLESLLRERLRANVDVERLLVLLARPDPPLWAAAVGADGRRRFWTRQRAGLRRWGRAGLGAWLPAVMGWSETLAAVRAAGDPYPRSLADRPRWVVDPAAPRPGGEGQRVDQREPERVEVSQWQVVPALIREARARGARVWFVAPAVRPSERSLPCARNARFVEVVDALDDLGAEVLDASDVPLPEAGFRTRYHLEPDSAVVFTKGLANALAGQPLPGRRCTANEHPSAGAPVAERPEL